jgi:hypothetical protein
VRAVLGAHDADPTDQVPVRKPAGLVPVRPPGSTADMTYPAFDTSGLGSPIEPRNGPVTCTSCGCRLERSADGRGAWFHFSPMAGRDARGCKVACADSAHDAAGRAAS